MPEPEGNNPDNFQNSKRMLIAGMEGAFIYQAGYQLQHYFYNDKPIIPEPLSEQLRPFLGNTIEFGLLRGQTSLSSFGAVLFAAGFTDTVISWIENAAIMTGHESVADLAKWGQVAAPIFLGLLNTFIEVGDMLHPPYPDNDVADLVVGWIAAAIVLGTFLLNRRSLPQEMSESSD